MTTAKAKAKAKGVTANTDSNDKENNPNPGPGPKRKPFYLNWQLWLVFLISILLVLAGSALTFGIRSVIQYLSDPINYAGFVAAVLAIVGVAATIIKIFSPLGEGISKLWEAFGKLEKKTDKAAAVTTNNSADIKALTDGYRGLVDEMQQEREARQKERDEYRAEIVELKTLLREANRDRDLTKEEISELKRQLREVNRESLSDKQQIAFLQAKVSNLEMEVAKLIVENLHLSEENRELKFVSSVRRGTDKLQLPPDIQPEFDKLEAENKEIEEKKGEN